MRTPPNAVPAVRRRGPVPPRIEVVERRAAAAPPARHREASGMAADLASVVAIVVLLGMLLLQPFTWISERESVAAVRVRVEAVR
jgi:hypothetical protein